MPLLHTKLPSANGRSPQLPCGYRAQLFRQINFQQTSACLISADSAQTAGGAHQDSLLIIWLPRLFGSFSGIEPPQPEPRKVAWLSVLGAKNRLRLTHPPRSRLF